MIIVCGSWSPLQLPGWPLVGTRRGAFAMGVLRVGWERGFGPAVSIRVVAFVLVTIRSFRFLCGFRLAGPVAHWLGQSKRARASLNRYSRAIYFLAR